MLSDLEERGLIEKFKKGRGNIIRIPDEHISKQIEDERSKQIEDERSKQIEDESKQE
jgi:predicted transcriptional regulator of viral defense system